MSEEDNSSFDQNEMNLGKAQFSCHEFLDRMWTRARSWLNSGQTCRLLLQCLTRANVEQQEEQNQTEELEKFDCNLNKGKDLKNPNHNVFGDASSFGQFQSIRQNEEASDYENFENLYYDMSKTKYLLVFNHEEFNYAREFGFKKPMTRFGTHFDVENLKSTFKTLGFTVKIYQDLTQKRIIRNVEKFVNQDHSNTSCVVVAILTHGESNGYLYAKNKRYHLDEIKKLLQHQKLVLIPKLLIVQACRGELIDEGVEVDGIPKNLLVDPTHTDFLILRSTVEGYVSFRDRTKGSWMIQHLCAVILEYHSTMDILQMITMVNMRVARSTAYNVDERLNAKQSLETAFSLTKLWKL